MFAGRSTQTLMLFSYSCLFVVFVDSLRAAEPTYWQDVRPVLRKYCTVCHSARHLKEAEVSGGLALDSYEAVVKNDTKALLKVGSSSESLLVQLVTSTDDDKRMPLGARPLPEDAIAALRRWIDGGAREGQRPEAVAAVAAGTGPRRTGKLDVLLPTSATFLSFNFISARAKTCRSTSHALFPVREIGGT